MTGTPRELIRLLSLAPHPEGGWYRETWRADAAEGRRASATAIYFLLEAGQRSHWHTVDAAELWFWHAGHPLELLLAEHDQGPTQSLTLGGDVRAGELPQALVPTGYWQAADAGKGWALVSCVVSPGFEFSGFHMAEAGWAPGKNL